MSLQSPKILYEDNYILVCVKPAGIATQSKRIGIPDMVSILKNHIAQNHNASGKSGALAEPYLAIIHRLDQPVQGIMVFAKTPFAAKELSRELQSKGFGKHYRALVLGAPLQRSGTLENYMIKDGRTNTSHICKKEAVGAKVARLSYQTVPENEHYFSMESKTSQDASFCELDICLDTGRHHQIRVQLANIGCPIIGDTKYNKKSSPDNKWQELKLCSYHLEFTHPKTKKRLSFSLI